MDATWQWMFSAALVQAVKPNTRVLSSAIIRLRCAEDSLIRSAAVVNTNISTEAVPHCNCDYKGLLRAGHCSKRKSHPPSD